MLRSILLVGFGGFIGSVLRFFVSKLNISIEFYSIPIGTLLVNIVGSFIIGFLSGFFAKSDILSPGIKLLLITGFCGGFTTFSSFSNENFILMHNGQFLSMILYTGISILGGFIAVYLGYNASNML